jgi:hypothetical protein
MTYRDDIVELVAQERWLRGAACGLGTGALFEALLEQGASELFLIGIDHFVREDRKLRVLNIAQRFSGRCTVLVMRTGQAAPLVPDGSLDFAFIDAGHKYGCVRADLRAWWPKVREGGWLGGHGFASTHPGVVAAVTEKFGAVDVSDNNVWSVRK